MQLNTLKHKHRMKLEIVETATLCNLTPPNVAPVVLARFFAKFVLRIHTNCYFQAFCQHSNIIIRFSNPDFTKESNISTSGLCDLMTLNTDHMLISTLG